VGDESIDRVSVLSAEDVRKGQDIRKRALRRCLCQVVCDAVHAGAPHMQAVVDLVSMRGVSVWCSRCTKIHALPMTDSPADADAAADADAF